MKYNHVVFNGKRYPVRYVFVKDKIALVGPSSLKDAGYLEADYYVPDEHIYDTSIVNTILNLCA